MIGINHDLRCVNGKYIRMPPYKGGQAGWGNLEIPNPFLCDTSQRYPTGTKLLDGYRTFIYTYLQEASCGMNVHNTHGYGVLSENVPVNPTVVTALGSTTTLVATIANVTANQYAGGFAALYEDGIVGISHMCRIESNTATDDPVADQAVFTLSDPITVTGFSVAATCRLHPDPYSNVRFSLNTRSTAHNYEMLAGIWLASFDTAGAVAVEGDYGWIQTWGPCFTWCSITYQGDTSREREVYHYGGGGVQINVVADEHPEAQRVGFLVPATCADPGVSTSGAVVDQMEHIVWLQIER